ncbi:geranylgeranyl transferase type-2 subunit beta [Capronia coronata CBS 617.96]|uniref:Geranylgeranyl transferase type-2 subunit alpha n=1 Tax=Capronia coronata CBS 617.96 TaxID=1182541 RepID=W9XND5_9EURO|nr:geranylgeranyl transferase type-2 subunit beta [Capronia coronata CBS 617.96]EXJ81748.1 geranylgeranyl transferase type-2 subunit beta [Capronia coronata CBS 617.96]
MTSHGIPRSATREERTADARQRELKEISEYQRLVEEVNQKVQAEEFTPELLQKTAELLRRNPEYYTIWNHRRRIYVHEFQDLEKQVSAGELEEDSRVSQVLDIIQLDLQFLFPLLLKFPKCYWIWNHRLWLLQQATALLPVSKARPLWEEELGLVGKMLSRDSRNFHGWGYRRIVVQSLESPTLHGQSMSRQELDYTKQMIGINLSNFSAWHNRSKLILKVLDEENASDEERKKMLDAELELIHQALFDPYDQSLWFYHQNLMCSFDLDLAERSMAPNLSNEQRLTYIASERRYIEEVLEDAQDCKWPYQALIECTLLEAKLRQGLQDDDKKQILQWLKELKTLDPLREGRWVDMEQSLIKGTA